jgi:TRAP-type C4-dicarboxylate transport system substrate-binding protein
MKTIRWVLAHEPIELFLRAAKHFKATMEEKMPGAINLEILTLSEYAEKYKPGEKITKHDLLQLMEDGEIEMSQMYTSTLGRTHAKDMWALDMPFIFKDHDHAQEVLEGDIGKSLLAGLNKNSNVQGLAFTYSGGFRMIPPIAEETLSAVGAIPVPMELEQINEGIKSNDIVGGESTYPRFYGLKQNEFMDTINDAEHSLFLTSILVAKDFWNTLDLELQTEIEDASFDAARAERVWSVEDIDIVKSKCEEDTIKVVTMSDEERLRFKEATEYMYEKYDDMFTPGLLESIKKVN